MHAPVEGDGLLIMEHGAWIMGAASLSVASSSTLLALSLSLPLASLELSARLGVDVSQPHQPILCVL